MSFKTPPTNGSFKTPPSMSTKDKQFNYCLILKQIGSRLSDVHYEIESLYDVLIASESRSQEEKKMLSNLRLSILPFLLKASKQTFDASTILSPIASTNYVHKRAESERRRLANNEADNISRKAMKSSPLKRIDLINSNPDPVQKPNPLQDITHATNNCATQIRTSFELLLAPFHKLHVL